MRKRLFIFLFLLIMVPPCERTWANDIATIMGTAIDGVASVCGVAKASIASFGGGGVPAGEEPLGDPDAWYSSIVAEPPTVDDTWTNTAWTLGAPVVITTGGQITRIGMYVTPHGSNTVTLTVQLWKLVGETWTSHECKTVSLTGGGGAAWYDTADLTSPYTVGNGETVRITGTIDGSITSYFTDEFASGGFFQTGAGSCPESLTWSADYNVAVRAGVVE